MQDVEITTDRKPLWRMVWEFPLVALALALAMLFSTLFGVRFLLPYLPTSMNPDVNAAIEFSVGALAVFLIYKLGIRFLGAERKDDLPAKGALTDTILGLGAGAAIFTVVVGLATVFGAYRILGWGSAEDLFQIVMITGVWAAVFEEVFIRGIVFRWTEEFAGSWAALFVSSLLFGALHYANPNATLWATALIAIEAGILLGGAYMLTRSLWLAIGLHAGWNVTQGFVWGVPVSGNPFVGMVEAGLYGPDWLSGGAFGLEASVIALVVATGAGLWMVWQAAKAGRIVKPLWMRDKA